jgi:hypothetical protein
LVMMHVAFDDEGPRQARIELEITGSTELDAWEFDTEGHGSWKIEVIPDEEAS